MSVHTINELSDTVVIGVETRAMKQCREQKQSVSGMGEEKFLQEKQNRTDQTGTTYHLYRKVIYDVKWRDHSTNSCVL